MPVTVLIGAQWGDEGKGRYVDYFAEDAQIVARYQGGDNAGHTIAIGDTVYKLHLIPSGVLREGVVGVMGNGMVINPISLLDEMRRLRGEGIRITPENLKISSRAHIITAAHRRLDAAKEAARGEGAIGTTLKGIGPAYLDKVGRRGLRIGMLRDVEAFAEAAEAHFSEHNAALGEYQLSQGEIAHEIKQLVEAADEIRPYITDTTAFLNNALREEQRIVCEGAQGTLLDIDHGSYPFATSSSPTVGGALTGLGVGPTYVDQVIGVAKAFSTRVGAGPMPTEDTGDVGDRLRGSGENFWDEFGTTTGRARRCGWLDGVMLRYATAVNGFTEIMLTKLDILSGFREVQIAVAYEVDGRRMDFPPDTIVELERAQPIFETLSGWQDDLSQARDSDDLPKAALAYIKRIEKLAGVPIRMVSVGPEREQTVAL